MLKTSYIISLFTLQGLYTATNLSLKKKKIIQVL